MARKTNSDSTRNPGGALGLPVGWKPEGPSLLGALLVAWLLLGASVTVWAQGEDETPREPPPYDQGPGDEDLGDPGYDDQGHGDEDFGDQGFDDPGFDDQDFGDQGYDDQGYDDQDFGDQGYDDQGYDDQGFGDQDPGDDGLGDPARDFGDEGFGNDGFGQGGFDQGSGLGDQIALPLSDLALRDARSELMVAIETRDHAGVQEVLTRGEDIGLDAGRPSPLATAALLGDRRTVALLLRAGADPAGTSDSPLLEAVRSDEAEIVELLLQSGAEVPGQSSHEELFGGALRGANREAIYDLLLGAGGDPAVCLQVAVDAQRPDLAERCLAAGADLAALSDPAALITLYPNTERQRLLALASSGEDGEVGREVLLARLMSVAAAAGDSELIELVMAEGAVLTVGDLASALASGHRELVFELVERSGRDAAELADEAAAAGLDELAAALRERRREQWAGWLVSVAIWVVPAVLLLAVGFSVAGRQKRSPKRLHRAIDAGDAAAVARLLRAGADPEGRRDGLAALHRAVLRGDARIVSALLRRGADGGARIDDARGFTALHLAAEVGSIEIAQLLVRSGVAVEVRASGGETPLYAAAVSGQRAMVEWLIERGADVEKTMGRGSLLCHAVLAKSLGAVHLLLEHGAEPNPDSGRQPLHLAVLGGQTELARALLSAGADPSIRDDQGKTLLELAQQHQQVEIAQLLRGWGGG